MGVRKWLNVDSVPYFIIVHIIIVSQNIQIKQWKCRARFSARYYCIAVVHLPPIYTTLSLKSTSIQHGVVLVCLYSTRRRMWMQLFFIGKHTLITSCRLKQALFEILTLTVFNRPPLWKSLSKHIKQVIFVFAVSPQYSTPYTNIFSSITIHWVLA